MANTYQLIASNTLGSSAASVTFNSIPSTYSNLVLKISARSERTALTDSLVVKINDTTTGYSATLLQSDATNTPASSRQSSASFFSTSQTGLVGNSATSNTFGNIELYFPSYTASQNKPFSTFGAPENNATIGRIGVLAGLWSNTAAITKIVLEPGVPNFMTGSSFWLYGIKNS